MKNNGWDRSKNVKNGISSELDQIFEKVENFPFWNTDSNPEKNRFPFFYPRYSISPE